ncbi:MAG: transposase [Spirochaetia bacterium]|nr:transposase [Spirochaetia bacterium]
MEFKEEFKKEMVRKLLLPGGKGAIALGREIGVTTQTLYNWRDRYSNDNVSTHKKRDGRSNEEKAKAVLEFARLSKDEIGEWLRMNGLKSEHLELWERDLMTMSDTNKYREENRILKIKNKELEKDLSKKNKALAELSAIVILKKKLENLFPSEKED